MRIFGKSVYAKNSLRLAGLALLALSSSATAQTVFVADVGTENGILEFQATNRSVFQKADSDGKIPLRYGFQGKNISGALVEGYVIGAHIFSADGVAKGFFSQTSEGQIPAGMWFQQRFIIGDVMIEPTDRILLVLEEVRSTDTLWQLDTEAWSRINAFETVTETDLGPVPEKAGPGTNLCTLFCDARETKCSETTCAQSGVHNFSCGLSGTAGCTSSCTCQPIRPPTG